MLPTAEAVAPKIIKTNEKPRENKIVLISTTLLSCSISFKFFPVIYEIYPGIMGKTHGVKKLINPAPKAKANFKIMFTLYLPLNYTTITILAHDNKIYWISHNAVLVLFFH